MREPVSPTQKTLNIWAIILIIWSLYRAKFQTDLPIWFDELIMKPIVFVLPLYYFITRIEKKNFFTSINLTLKNVLFDIGIGVLIGLVFFVSGQVGNLIKNHSLVLNIKQSPTELIILIVVSLATAFCEEILSRGFVLKRLYSESKNIISAIFISSLLFFFLHIPMLLTSEKIIGFMLLRLMITDFLLSITVSIAYLERKSLVLPIIIHALYSLNIYLFV